MISLAQNLKPSFPLSSGKVGALFKLMPTQKTWGRVFVTIAFAGVLSYIIGKIAIHVREKFFVRQAPALPASQEKPLLPVTPLPQLPVVTEETLLTTQTSSPKELQVHPRDWTPPASPSLEPPRKKVAARLADEPTRYTKGITETPPQAQTNKRLLGTGQAGRVYEHKHHTGQVVKKSSSGMCNEFKVGKRLDNPQLFVQMHHYYIKKDVNGRDRTHRLVMDRLSGKEVHAYYVGKAERLNPQQLLNLVNQAEQACLYLFERGVFWRDVHSQNIFVSHDAAQLTFLDFAEWQICDNPQLRAKQLLLGSMELMGWLVKSSFVRSPILDREKEWAVMYPPAFFNEQIKNLQILTFYSERYKNMSWMNRFEQQLGSNPVEKYPELLSNYFAAVRQQLQPSG